MNKCLKSFAKTERFAIGFSPSLADNFLPLKPSIKSSKTVKKLIKSAIKTKQQNTSTKSKTEVSPELQALAYLYYPETGSKTGTGKTGISHFRLSRNRKWPTGNGRTGARYFRFKTTDQENYLKGKGLKIKELFAFKG